MVNHSGPTKKSPKKIVKRISTGKKKESNTPSTLQASVRSRKNEEAESQIYSPLHESQASSYHRATRNNVSQENTLISDERERFHDIEEVEEEEMEPSLQVMRARNDRSIDSNHSRSSRRSRPRISFRDSISSRSRAKRKQRSEFHQRKSSAGGSAKHSRQLSQDSRRSSRSGSRYASRQQANPQSSSRFNSNADAKKRINSILKEPRVHRNESSKHSSRQLDKNGDYVKENRLSEASTMEATQVKKIYGQLKQKSSQLNTLLDQLSKIVQI